MNKDIQYVLLADYTPGKETAGLGIPVCGSLRQFSIYCVTRLRLDTEARKKREEGIHSGAPLLPAWRDVVQSDFLLIWSI